jgi:hypothetical protein
MFDVGDFIFSYDLQSSTNRGLLDLLNATVSGLTINDFVETSLIHPLFSKFVISEATKSLFSSDDRLVLDCRHINPHLHKYRFICEDGKVAREMFDVGDFIFSYDLISAYHHIEIFEEHEHYLG